MKPRAPAAPLPGAGKPRRSMLTASCHCGTVRVHVRPAPRTVTSCNCSICRRYGALWAYYKASSVRVEAPAGGLSSYSWRRRIRAYYRCNTCGCVTHYAQLKERAHATVAVNASTFDPQVLARAHPQVRRREHLEVFRIADAPPAGTQLRRAMAW